MTAFERFRRRGRAMASFLMPLLAVVSINASACVGMTADGAATGFAKALDTRDGDAPHGLHSASHDLHLAHGTDSSHGHEHWQDPGHIHRHDNSPRPADSDRPDRSHGHGSADESMALHAGVLHEHGNCVHCPSAAAGEVDSGHVVCKVAEGAVAAATSAPAVQWDQKPILSPIAWIAPPTAAPRTRVRSTPARAVAVPPDARPLHVRYCVLLL